MWTRHVFLAAVLLVALRARANSAFAWDGEQTLSGAKGTLSWKCAAGSCTQVRLRYTGFGSVFVAPWYYRFGAGPGAPYLQYEHENEKFMAKSA